MAMKMKWVLAGLGAVALAAVANTSAMPWLSHSDVHTVSAEACPIDAKPANLNFTLKDMNDKDVNLASYKGRSRAMHVDARLTSGPSQGRYTEGDEVDAGQGGAGNGVEAATRHSPLESALDADTPVA